MSEFAEHQPSSLWMHRSSDRGSMPMAMLVVIIGSALAVILLPLLFAQNQLTAVDSSRAAALQGAESGIAVGIGELRTASKVNAEGFDEGDTTRLPCGVLSGTAGDEGAASYNVEVRYFIDDPSAHTDDAVWLAERAMHCVPGYGVHGTVGGEHIYIPNYALLTATGKGATTAATRTLVSVYEFRTMTTSIAGGDIRIWPEDATNPFCMDVGASEDWRVGTKVLLQPCAAAQDDGPAGQMWAYNPNLTIQLTASIGDERFADLGNSGEGLCLGTTMSTAQSSGQNLTLQACPDDPPTSHAGEAPQRQTMLPGPNYRLMWSIDDNSNFVSSNQAGDNHGSNRIHVANQGSGTEVRLSSGSGSTTSVNYTWIPSLKTGAGSAGAPSRQLANFAQFGRCLDVTNQAATGTGKEYLILYACKQNPDPARVTWNQRFVAKPQLPDDDPAPQVTQWVTRSGTDYCLTTANGTSLYVHVETCETNTAKPLYAQQQWTSMFFTDFDGDRLAPRYQFTMVDNDGRCLAPGPNDDQHDGQYYKLIAAGCTGNMDQKWNVPRDFTSGEPMNINELLGSR